MSALRRGLTVALSLFVILVALWLMQFGVNGLSASVSECAAFSPVAAKAVSAAMLAIVLGMVGTALVTIGRASEGGRVAVPVAGQIALVLLAWFTALLMGGGTSC